MDIKKQLRPEKASIFRCILTYEGLKTQQSDMPHPWPQTTYHFQRMFC